MGRVKEELVQLADVDLALAAQAPGRQRVEEPAATPWWPRETSLGPLGRSPGGLELDRTTLRRKIIRHGVARSAREEE